MGDSSRKIAAGVALVLLVAAGWRWWSWAEPPVVGGEDDPMSADEERALMQEIGYLK